MSKKIIIVEDEKAIADILQFNLSREGFEVLTFNDGKSGLEGILEGSADLVLLDVMLPFIDGFQILEQVRKVSQVPIIMLTAREEETDKILGLENGADDYITKPFSMRELIARIKANTRREVTVAKPEAISNIRVINDDISIDDTTSMVIFKGQDIELTSREFEIIKFLSNTPNKIYSREQLMKEVWGYEYYGDLRAVDVAILRLRQKLEEDTSKPKYIVTKRGQGYYFKG